MKKSFNCFSFLISHFSPPKGFTLIEMLVVFAIIGSLTIMGVNSFFSYSRSANFKTTVADVSHALNDIRSRAISQVKPSQCAVGAPLQGYRFSIPVSRNSYTISVRCGGTYYTLSTTNLPANVTFTSGSTSTTFFNVTTGTVATTSTIILTGYGKTSTLTVSTTGIVTGQ